MAEASLVKLPLIRMSLDFTDDQSTLVQVINWANVDTDLCRHMALLSHSELRLNSIDANLYRIICRQLESHVAP